MFKMLLKLIIIYLYLSFCFQDFTCSLWTFNDFIALTAFCVSTSPSSVPAIKPQYFYVICFNFITHILLIEKITKQKKTYIQINKKKNTQRSRSRLVFYSAQFSAPAFKCYSHSGAWLGLCNNSKFI